MFGRPGIAYVYLVYGMYDCLNVVTEPADRPAAVLIRAVEPVAGVAAMRRARAAAAAERRRGVDAERELARLEALPAHRIAAGPGLVGAAFGLTRADTGRDLCSPASPIRLAAADAAAAPIRVGRGPRIGVGYAGEPWRSRPWRLVDLDSPSLSQPG